MFFSKYANDSDKKIKKNKTMKDNIDILVHLIKITNDKRLKK